MSNITAQTRKETSEEVSELEDKLNSLITVLELLSRLIKLRAVSIVLHVETLHQLKSRGDSKPKEEIKISQELLGEPLLELALSLEDTPLQKYQEQLPNLLYSKTDATTEEEQASKEKEIMQIKNDIDLTHKKLNSLFNHSLLPISIRGEVVQTLMPKIGHPELFQEAESNYKIINRLLTSIQALLDEDEDLNSPEKKKNDGVDAIDINKLLDLDVLHQKAQSIIGAMTAIELRRLRMEELFFQDQKKRRRTVRLAAIYIIVIATVILIIPALITFFPGIPSLCEEIRWQCPVFPSSENISTHKVPMLNIPIAVITWSFIGSFAAMIHRFNRNSVYYFNDLVKWMLTRHVQGIVLSSAFYLILVSGLFLMSGDEQSSNPIKDEVILVLSFLIGFSDRFVDSVFDTLIERYSRSTKVPMKRKIVRSKYSGIS